MLGSSYSLALLLVHLMISIIVCRQVMTYREEIRTSPVVRFAMEVFNAVNSNNSVRFFKLVR